MFELVKTTRQQKNFEKTWEYFCAKYGWDNDPYSVNGTRYNLLLPKERFYKRRKVIGTVEFIPYDPDSPYSTVEGPNRFPFSASEEFIVNQHRIWEIDKLCIHQNYQRRGYIQVLFQILIDHALKHKAIYYLALTEKRFFRMLKILFGDIIEQKGEELVGPTTALVPSVIRIGSMIDDDETLRKAFNKVTKAIY